MQIKKLRKLRLPKETLTVLSRHEVGKAAGALTTLPCSKAACTNPCVTNTAKVGECCS